MAARVPTLPAAVVPVFVGTAIAYRIGTVRPWAFVAALLSSLFIQIGTNFANDVFDFRKGADTEKRTGPTRITQAGLASPQQVFVAMWICFGAAVVCGLYLIYLGGWPILLIGLSGIAAGILYTGGPWPFGYHGLGDLVTFAFFGVIAVLGTLFVHTGSVDFVSFLISLPVACLVTAILTVNNLRDIETDRVANKRTLAVRLGRAGTQAEFALLLLVAFVIPPVLWLFGPLTVAALLPWLTVPLAFKQWRIVKTQHGAALNEALKGTGKLHLFFGLLFTIGLLW